MHRAQDPNEQANAERWRKINEQQREDAIKKMMEQGYAVRNFEPYVASRDSNPDASIEEQNDFSLQTGRGAWSESKRPPGLYKTIPSGPFLVSLDSDGSCKTVWAPKSMRGNYPHDFHSDAALKDRLRVMIEFQVFDRRMDTIYLDFDVKKTTPAQRLKVMEMANEIMKGPPAFPAKLAIDPDSEFGKYNRNPNTVAASGAEGILKEHWNRPEVAAEHNRRYDEIVLEHERRFKKTVSPELYRAEKTMQYNELLRDFDPTKKTRLATERAAIEADLAPAATVDKKIERTTSEIEKIEKRIAELATAKKELQTDLTNLANEAQKATSEDALDGLQKKHADQQPKRGEISTALQNELDDLRQRQALLIQKLAENNTTAPTEEQTKKLAELRAKVDALPQKMHNAAAGGQPFAADSRVTFNDQVIAQATSRRVELQTAQGLNPPRRP